MSLKLRAPTGVTTSFEVSDRTPLYNNGFPVRVKGKRTKREQKMTRLCMIRAWAERQ